MLTSIIESLQELNANLPCNIEDFATLDERVKTLEDKIEEVEDPCDRYGNSLDDYDLDDINDTKDKVEELEDQVSDLSERLKAIEQDKDLEAIRMKILRLEMRFKALEAIPAAIERIINQALLPFTESTNEEPSES